MEGYEVIGSDGGKVGEVVGVESGLLIVEGGLLRKSRHAVPATFAHADDDELDSRAVAAHYGLAEGEEAPETEGYGDLRPDDPAWGAEHQERRSGVEPAVEERAKIREGRSEAGPHGRPIIPPDPHEGP